MCCATLDDYCYMIRCLIKLVTNITASYLANNFSVSYRSSYTVLNYKYQKLINNLLLKMKCTLYRQPSLLLKGASPSILPNFQKKYDIHSRAKLWLGPRAYELSTGSIVPKRCI